MAATKNDIDVNYSLIRIHGFKLDLKIESSIRLSKFLASLSPLPSARQKRDAQAKAGVIYGVTGKGMHAFPTEYPSTAWMTSLLPALLLQAAAKVCRAFQEKGACIIRQPARHRQAQPQPVIMCYGNIASAILKYLRA
ncbi:MAG: hypothetical protein M0Z83_10320 [Betaproteobacteria bacterium]|nr:hypothetical protein [Betaproteobacteria bacterium]